MWDKEEMKNIIREFECVYDQRPIKNNDGGMKSPHMLPAWFIMRKLQPELIIESGVYKGLGTWFFENACPNSKIISLDPNPHFRTYTSNNVEYSTIDFSNIDIPNIDSDKTLVFFDDHQNAMNRISQCIKKGVHRIVFEDNYPFDQGDCYSVKKILSGSEYVIDKSGNRTTHDANLDDKKYLESIMEIYEEAPPIFRPKNTRWGGPWSYDTPDPLYSMNDIGSFLTFAEEIFDYTWMCYVKLKK